MLLFEMGRLTRMLLALGVLSAAAGCGYPIFQLGEQRVVGNELRVLVETSHNYYPFYAHMPTTSDIKGWLVLVDLSKTGPMISRSRVIGPLWETPDSAIWRPLGTWASTSGVGFDPNASVARVSLHNRGKMVRETLSVVGRKAVWKLESQVAPNPDIVMGYYCHVETRSGRYHGQRVAGKVSAFDLTTQKQLDDPWLQQVLTQCWGIDHFEHEEPWLTDDLRYLVCNPFDQRRNRVTEYTFQFNGKTYDRASYCIVWSRPNMEPAVFKKEAGIAVYMKNGPAAAFSIDGRLFLYYHDRAKLRLVPLDGGKAFEADAPVDANWTTAFADTAQFDEANHRIIFFSTDSQTHHTLQDGSVVFIWDYQAGTVKQFDARIPNLFDQKWQHFVPKERVAVDRGSAGTTFIPKEMARDPSSN